jgi:transposase
MSRSKWVVGIHTRLADKIALHTMACNDVEALLALINRARVKLIASGSNSPAAMICYEVGTKASGLTTVSSRSVSASW